MNYADEKMAPSEYPELTFLIVDDDEMVYEVATLDNVRSTLERVRNENPDKVITATIGVGRLLL